MAKVRILTLNLAMNSYRRWERLSLVVEEIKRLNPDVVMLQEVDFTAGVDKKLAEVLNEYIQSKGRRSGKSGHLGQLTLTKEKPLSNNTLKLSQDRVALKTAIKVGSCELNIVNVHLFFGPLRDKPRVQQVKNVLEFSPVPTLMAGDFNTRSSAGSLKPLIQRFKSAHSHVHIQEPQRTYPTPLKVDRTARTFLRRRLIDLLGILTAGSKHGWGVTIDFIFVDKDLDITDCKVVFDNPSKLEPKLYASDHYGLLADISI